MKEIYGWVPWFRELVEKIAEGGEAYLTEKAKQVTWGEDTSLPQHGDKGIDPFSFFYFLATKSTSNQPELVYNSVSRGFEIKSPPPDMRIDDYYLFPTSGHKILFHDKTNFYLDLLWRLFREAKKDNPKINPDDFKKALDIKEVVVEKLTPTLFLTQTLFLINPKYFLPLDSFTGVLPEALDLPAQSEIENEIKKQDGYGKYQSHLKKFQDAFPGCQPYEINMFLYLQKSGRLINAESKFFQISTYVLNDGVDYWEDFKDNNWVYTGAWYYPLAEPKRGDIILVRTGYKRGRAIGIVLKNDYKSEYKEDYKIHVLWINKSEKGIVGTDGQGFSQAPATNQTYKNFEKSYKPSFDLINSLTGNSPENDSGPELNNQQTKVDAMKYPLNQILYGPPGTGKTWNTVNRAVAIIDGKSGNDLKEEICKINEGESLADFERDKIKERFDKLKEDGRIAMVTFHQNFTYEDFIEGIRPVLDDEDRDIEYELHKGVFREIADQAREDSDQNYVLIIDEINRGNIAKIFSELITLIEPSKRIGSKKDETTVTLPYSKKKFGVSNNLYIIGTMNTADRSIAPLDTALRRRFEFIEMMPDLEHHKISTDIKGVNCQELLAAMNKRIRFLFDREHQIGHTYLLGVNDLESLATTFKNQIIPLLQEYFYDDWEKIDLVLNCNGFIDPQPSIDSNLFKNSDLIDEERKIYELLPDDNDKWKTPKSYQTIYREKGEGDNDGTEQDT